MSEPAIDPKARERRHPRPAVRPQAGGMVRAGLAFIAHEALVLDPGYFALVMATGIVSNAFYLGGHRILSDALFAVNLLAYGWLWLLTALRLARFGAALCADLLDPHRVFLFFTAVAATDVLGMSLGLRGCTTIAVAMALLAAALWLGLIYLGFGVFMFRNAAGGADVAEGAWLNAIVGTQSLVVVGAALALPAAQIAAPAYIVLHLLWTIGLVLYGIFIALFCYRIFFSALEPDDVAPPLWVVMGAAAISVNAGSILTAKGGATAYLRSLEPFVDGITLALWAWATWWIPLLILLGIWKHAVHRRLLGYTPLLWSMVFPLGMYAVATLRLSRLADIPALAAWSAIMAWIALAAWLGTSVGLMTAAFRRVRAVVDLVQWFDLAAFGGRMPRQR